MSDDGTGLNVKVSYYNSIQRGCEHLNQITTTNHKSPPHGGARGKIRIIPLGTICATFHYNPLNSCKDICLDQSGEPINQKTDMSNPRAAEQKQKYRWKK